VPDFELALNGMRAELGLAPISVETIKPMVGKGSEKLIRDVLSLDLPADRVEQLFDQAMAAYQRHYIAINGERSALYAEVVEGLAKLKSLGLRMACVTNKPVAFAKPLLGQKGLAPYFELMYGGDSLSKKKPHPLPLLQVCRDFALEPAEVVAIGDSSNDAEAARAAGCFVLTVPYGYNHGRPVHEIDSDGIVGTLLEAANLIEAHNSKAN
jgi:phosphoglycolate phosphatase